MINSTEQRLEHIVNRMQHDTSVDAPADARKFVKDLFRTRALEPNVSAVRRVMAAIVMELGPNKAAFGERSGSASATRQMLFEAGDAAVDLRIEAAGKKFCIRGQVIGEGFGGAEATLADNAVEVTTTLDEIGGFRFADVKPGEYSLTIRRTGDQIVIESLVIK